MVSKRNLNFMIVAALGLLALYGPAWGSEPTEGLVADWKLDEGEGTVAYDSAGENHGTIYGAEWTTGQIGGALSFDGDGDYVDCGSDESLEPGDGSFTIGAWIKAPNQNQKTAIVTKRQPVTPYEQYCFYIGGETPFTVDPGKKLQLSYIEAIGYGIPNNYRGAVTDDEYVDGDWHHVVVIADKVKDDIVFYVDGMGVSSTLVRDSGSWPTVNNTDPLYIGYEGAEYYLYFEGEIDDVRIYDRALSAEEIQQLYQAGFPALVGLEIVGPGEVAENFQAQYKAIAHYDNDSTRDVTDSSDWVVEPQTFASIDENGMLTTEVINRPEEVITIYAQYTEDGNTVDAEKAVSVFAVCPGGYALEFDGVNDYVDIQDDGTLSGMSGLSVAYWFKADYWPSWESDNGSAGLVCKMNNGDGREISDCYIISACVEKNKHKIYAALSSGTDPFRDRGSVNILVEDAVADFNPFAWHHLTLTYDADTVRLYLDAKKVGEAPFDKVPLNANAGVPLRIGHIYGRSAHNLFFKGRIDEVAIYNRALSAAEIRATMHTRLTGDEPNLVGYWSFDEGEGQIVYDLSGNGNHGRLGSAPDPDGSDPAWVESDATVGICTVPQVIERNISDALSIKLNILEEIEAALVKENAAIDMLDELFGGRDYGDWQKNDIVKAKQAIHWATQHQEQSKDALEKGAERLEDSLAALGASE